MEQVQACAVGALEQFLGSQVLINQRNNLLALMQSDAVQVIACVTQPVKTPVSAAHAGCTPWLHVPVNSSSLERAGLCNLHVLCQQSFVSAQPIWAYSS